MIAIEANGWMAVYIITMTILGTVVLVSAAVAVVFGIVLRGTQCRPTQVLPIESMAARDALHRL